MKKKLKTKSKPMKLAPRTYDLAPNEVEGCDARKIYRRYGYSDEMITQMFTKAHNDGIARREKMAREATAYEESKRRLIERDAAERPARANGTKTLQTENTTSVKAVATEGKEGGRRYNIFGHVVTAVLRWMGKDAWTFAQARQAMNKLGLPVADATLNAQLRAGVKGERGDPAKMTHDEIEKLYALIEERKPCKTTTNTKSPSSKLKASVSTSPPAPAVKKTKLSSPPRSGKPSSSSSAAPAKSNSTSRLGKSRKKNRRK